jgi:3-dehydroquinate synthetase
LLTRFRLPVNIPAHISVNGLCEALELDKKAIASGLRLILLRAVGQATVNSDCGQDEIITAMEQSQDRDRAGSKE